MARYMLLRPIANSTKLQVSMHQSVVHAMIQADGRMGKPVTWRPASTKPETFKSHEPVGLEIRSVNAL